MFLIVGVIRYEEEVLSRWPEIFVGCLAFVVIVIGIITWRCCVRRKRRRAAQQAKSMGIATGGQRPQSYRVLEADSTSNLNMHELSPKQPQQWEQDQYGQHNQYSHDQYNQHDQYDQYGQYDSHKGSV